MSSKPVGKRVTRSKHEKNKRISEKIEVLRKEGKSPEAAAGEAYGMEREGRLRSGGRYVRKGNGRRGRKAVRE